MTTATNKTKKPLLAETPEMAASALQGYFKLLLERKIFSETLTFSSYNEKWLEGVIKHLKVVGVQVEVGRDKDLLKATFKF